MSPIQTGPYCGCNTIKKNPTPRIFSSSEATKSGRLSFCRTYVIADHAISIATSAKKSPCA